MQVIQHQKTQRNESISTYVQVLNIKDLLTIETIKERSSMSWAICWICNCNTFLFLSLSAVYCHQHTKIKRLKLINFLDKYFSFYLFIFFFSSLEEKGYNVRLLIIHFTLPITTFCLDISIWNCVTSLIFLI